MITFYCLKNPESKSKISYYAKFYTYPFFHQNWNLFVPPPSSNYQLIACNGTSKTNIFNDILIKHQTNRLAGYETFVLALSNSIHYFEKNTKVKSGLIKNDANFKIVSHFVNNYLHLKTQNMSKIIIIITNISTKENRFYYN